MTILPSNVEHDKARRQMMTGVMLVMGSCVFGGLLAVVLMAIGQRTGAGVVAIVGGIGILIGIGIQVGGFRKLKVAQGQSR